MICKWSNCLHEILFSGRIDKKFLFKFELEKDLCRLSLIEDAKYCELKLL